MPADFSGGYRRRQLYGGGPCAGGIRRHCRVRTANPTAPVPAEAAGDAPPIMTTVPADPKNRRQKPSTSDQSMPADQYRRIWPPMPADGSAGKTLNCCSFNFT